MDKYFFPRLSLRLGLRLSLFSSLLCSCSLVFAAANEEAGLDLTGAEARGLAIATEADSRQRGFIDLSVSLEMVLLDAKGRENRRQLRIKTLESDTGDKTITVFDTPRDIRGTGLLIHSHKSGLDDQWLYLPGLKRVKRIASKNQYRPFVGSQFAYEDMASPELEKYVYRYLGEENCGEVMCYRIEQVPLDKFSGYSKQSVLIDCEEYRIQSIAFYDKRDVHIKTLTFSGYQRYKAKFWRPSSMLMLNHKNKRSTELLWRDYQFGIGLLDKDFTQNSLKRVR